MLAEVNELLLDLSTVPILDENNAIRAIRVTDNFKSWYSRDVEPLVSLGSSSSSSKIDGPEEDPAFVESYTPYYADIFIAILDCISSFTIIKLEKLIQGLLWNFPQMDKQLNLSISPSVSAQRHASLKSSYKFLREHSEHSVEPLSSALQQLCRLDTIIG